MAKNKGKLIAEIELRTSEAVKVANDYRKQLKALQQGYKELTQFERVYGETSDSTSVKLKNLKNQEDLLRDSRETAINQLSVYKKKQEEGIKLTDEDVKAYQRLTAEIGRLNNETNKVERSIGELNNRGLNLDDDLRSINKEMDRTIKKTVTWAETLSKVKSGFQNIQAGVGKMYSGASAIVKPLATAATTAIGVGINEFSSYEKEIKNIMRLASDSASEGQLETLKNTITDLYYTRGEDKSEISAALEKMVGKFDPADYGDALKQATNDVLNFSISSGLSQEDSAKIAYNLSSLLGLDSSSFKNILSAANQVENAKAVNASELMEMIGLNASQLKAKGFTFEETVALNALTSNKSSREVSGKSSGNVEMATLINKLTYETDPNNKKHQPIIQLQEDFRRYGGFNSVEEVREFASNNKIDAIVTLMRGIESEVKQRGGTVDEILSGKKWAPSNKQAISVFSDVMAYVDDLPEYLQEATKGYKEGTAVDEEAATVNDTFFHRMNLRYKRVLNNLREIGEAAIPLIEAVLDEFMPSVDELKRLTEYIRSLDVDEVVEFIKDALTKLFKAFLIFQGGKVVYGAGQVLWGATQIASALAKFSVVGKGAGAAATSLTTGASGIGGLSGALMALTNPLALTIAGLAGIGAAAYGIYKLNEDIAKNSVYSGLTGELRGKVRSDVDESRDSRSKVESVNRSGLNLRLTDDDVDRMRNESKNQLKTARDRIDSIYGDLSITETGNSEIDDALRAGLEDVKTNASGKISMMEELIKEQTFIFENLSESTTEAYKNQLLRLEEIKTEMDTLYADVLGDNRGSKQSIFNATTRATDVESLDFKAKNQRIQDLAKTRDALTRSFDEEIANIGQVFQVGSKNYNDAVDAATRNYNEGIVKVKVEASRVYGSLNWFDSMRIDSSLKSGDGQFSYEEYERMGEMATFIDRISSYNLAFFNPEDREIAESLMTYFSQMATDVETLNNASINGEFGLLINLIEERGLGALMSFRDLLGSDLGNQFWTDFSGELMTYIATIEELRDLTTEELAVKVYAQGTEGVRELMTELDLWGNEEALQKIAKLDLDTINAQNEIVKIADSLSVDIPDVVRSKVEVDTKEAELNIQRLSGAYSYLGHQMQNYHNPATLNRMTPKRYNIGTSLSGHPGGLAWVGDGGRREVIDIPGIGPMLSHSYPTLVDLPKGTHVFSSIDRYLQAIPKYATGTGVSTTNNYGGSLMLNLDVAGVDAVDLSNEIRRVVEGVIRKQQSQKFKIKKSGGR